MLIYTHYKENIKVNKIISLVIKISKIGKTIVKKTKKLKNR